MALVPLSPEVATFTRPLVQSGASLLKVVTSLIPLCWRGSAIMNHLRQAWAFAKWQLVPFLFVGLALRYLT